MDIERAGEIADRTVNKDARQDALKLTKTYLELFRSQKRYVKNLEEDIEDRYETATKMVSTYGEQIGHSSIVKLESGAILAGDEGHQQQRKEYKQAKHLAERLERAIEDLPHTERVILQERYINRDRETWEHIADVIRLDKRWCYRLCSRGLRSVAVSLFGLPDVLVAEKVKRDNRR